MSLSEKLSGGKKTAAAHEVKINPNACPYCDGEYVSGRVLLTDGNGAVCGQVCFRLVCYKCGNVKTYVSGGARKKCLYHTTDGVKYFWNPVNFWAPRELVEEPVYDKNGVPLFGKDGKQILKFSPALKKQFMARLVSLVKNNGLIDQYISLEDVAHANVPDGG